MIKDEKSFLSGEKMKKPKNEKDLNADDFETEFKEVLTEKSQR